MGIDQPGHQDGTAAVDDLLISARGALRNLADDAALHKNVDADSQRFRFAIEDAGGSKNNALCHLFFLWIWQITSKGLLAQRNPSMGLPWQRSHGDSSGTTVNL